MNRCVACANRRRFAAGTGLGWRSWLRVCYACWMQRQARLRVAGRVALLLLVIPLVTAAVIAFGFVVGQAMRLVGR